MFTPLHAAAAGGQVTVVKFLLELKAEVNATNSSGNTPLHIACLNGMDMVVSELLIYGASLHVTNHNGQVSCRTSGY